MNALTANLTKEDYAWLDYQWIERFRNELRDEIYACIQNEDSVFIPHEAIRPIRAELAETLTHMARIASTGNKWVWWNMEADDRGMTFTPVTYEGGES